jgi:hypothetical protein
MRGSSLSPLTMSRPSLALLSVALLACNTPPKEAHDSATVPSPAASAPAPASAAASVPASPAACTSDGECRLFSSYCAEAPCACRVLSTRDPEPKCLGNAASNVRCFADPCMGKAAGCQGGACVLTAK